MGVLEDYRKMHNGQIPALSRQELFGTPKKPEAMPQVDSANAMASLAELMGPTPVEREAAERRMQKNKAQMAAWTGLVDGLRQLGNLYYTAKGATPQRYTDNPMGQVEQNYQQQRQLWNDLANYRRQYNQGLYSLRRQMEQDKLAREMQKSTIDWRNSQQAERQRQFDERLQQQEKQLEERQRQFDERLRQQQEQFEDKQRQQQSQFEKRQRQQQSQFNERQKNKKTTKGKGDNNGLDQNILKGLTIH